MATLFEPTASPRVYGLPPGVDFPKALLRGLRERLDGHPPEALARIHLVVNSQRMKRRLEQLLHSATPFLLPSAIPSLRRQLQLGQLNSKGACVVILP